MNRQTEGVWWSRDDGAAVLLQTDDPGVLGPVVVDATVEERDARHGPFLTSTERRDLDLLTRLNRRAWRQGLGWNEDGVVLVPTVDGLLAYASDHAEEQAWRRVSWWARRSRPTLPSACALGPTSGVLVQVRTADGATVCARRSARVGSQRLRWGVTAGEHLSTPDIVDGRLDLRAATERALAEELAVAAGDVLDVEADGIVRLPGGPHHLAVTAEVGISAAELVDTAPSAPDSWEWDELRVVPLNEHGIEQAIERMTPLLPTARLLLRHRVGRSPSRRPAIVEGQASSTG